MKQKVLSILLALCLVLTMMPAVTQTASAATRTIDSISVSAVKAPVDGDWWKTDGYMSAGVFTSSGYTVSSVKWFNAEGNNLTGNFVAGRTYKAAVYLDAKDGYSFAAAEAITGTFNGKTITESNGKIRVFNSTEASIMYNFTASPKTIYNISVRGVKTPEDGDWWKTDGYASASIPEGVNYTVSSVEWFNAEGKILTGNFVAGRTYKGRVNLKADTGYSFNDEGKLTGTFNGVTVNDSNGKIRVFNNGAEATVMYNFTAAAKPLKTISSISVSGVKTPEDGGWWKTDGYTGASAPEGVNYTVSGVDWLNAEGKILTGNFVAGRTYKVRVGVKADTGYSFAAAENMTGILNGVIVNDSNGKIRVFKDGAEATITYNFIAAPKALKKINSISVSGIKEPAAGDNWKNGSAYTKANVPSAADYTVTGVEWLNGLAEPLTADFESGHSYGVMIYLKANDGCTFETAGTVNGLLNGMILGVKGKITVLNSGAEAKMVYYFELSKTIDSVAVSGVKEPVAGDNWNKDAAYTKATVPSGAKYNPDKVSWLDESGNTLTGAFEEGKTYTARVLLRANYLYLFNDKADVSFNGAKVGYGAENRTLLKDGEQMAVMYKFKASKKAEDKPADPVTPGTPGAVVDPSTGETVPASFDGMVIMLQYAAAVYNGMDREPEVYISDSKGMKLTEDTDYAVEYYDNRLVGKATVIITGLGKYKGITAGATFTIKPKAVTVKSLKKKSAGKLTVKWASHKTQTTGFQIRYSTSKKFTSYKSVTVSSKSATSKLIKGLKKGKTYYVKMRAYKTVDGKKIYSAWSKSKKAKA